MLRQISLFVSGLLFIISNLLLSACGQVAPTTTATQAAGVAINTTNVAPSNSAGSSVPSATVGATATATTPNLSALTFTDKTGFTLTLPKKAERIICLWTDCLDILKQLNIEPVAIDNVLYKIVAPAPYPLVDKAKTYTLIGGNFNEPNLEDIFKLQPDLVIGLATAHAALRPALKNIPLYLVFGQDYKEMISNLKTIGNLTGRSAEAEKASTKFLDKLNAYKTKSPKNKTVLLLATADGITFNVLTEKAVNCSLLKELANCPWPANTAQGPYGEAALNYTLEQLINADPQTIIAYIYPGRPKVSEQMANSPVWKELKAVKSGQLFEIDAGIAQPGGTLGLTVLLDTVMPLLYPEVFPTALP